MKCNHCGKEFTPDKFHVNSQRYCSKRCGDAERYLRRREEILAYQKQYRLANRDAINAWYRKIRRAMAKEESV